MSAAPPVASSGLQRRTGGPPPPAEGLKVMSCRCRCILYARAPPMTDQINTDSPEVRGLRCARGLGCKRALSVGRAVQGFCLEGGRRPSRRRKPTGTRPPTATEMGGGSVPTFSISQLTLRIAAFASREKKRKGQRKQQRTEGFDSLISSPSFDATTCVRTVITRVTNKQALSKKEQRKACLVPSYPGTCTTPDEAKTGSVFMHDESVTFLLKKTSKICPFLAWKSPS